MIATALRHKFVSQVADSPNIALVRPSNWNADHDLWLGFRDVAASTDLITVNDHLSVVRYRNMSGVAVALPDDLPQGFKVKLINNAAVPGPPGVRWSGTAGIVAITPVSSINGSSEPYELYQDDILELQRTDTTDYIGTLISGAVDSDGLGGEWQQLLTYTSPTQLRFSGEFIKINGVIHPIPFGGGLPGLSATGAPQLNWGGTTIFNPAVLGPNANYLVYVTWLDGEQAFGAGWPAGERLWGVFCPINPHPSFPDIFPSHFRSTTPGNEGVEVFMSSEGVLKDEYSLIGLIRTNSNSHFIDQASDRWVASWFNRRARNLVGANIGYATASTAWVDVGVGCSFMSWAFMGAAFAFAGGMSVNSIVSRTNYLAMAVNGVMSSNVSGQSNPSANQAYHLSNGITFEPGQDSYNWVTPMVAVLSGTGTYYGRIEGLIVQ